MQLFRQPRVDVNRATRPAGTVDGEAQVGLGFHFIARQQLAQIRSVLRLVERAQVDDRAGISRYAAKIWKTPDEIAKNSRFGAKWPRRQAFSFDGGRVGEVGHEISAVAQRRGLAGEGVRPTRIRIAPLSPLVITVDNNATFRPPGACGFASRYSSR